MGVRNISGKFCFAWYLDFADALLLGQLFSPIVKSKRRNLSNPQDTLIDILILVQTLCSGLDLLSGSVACESYGYWQAGPNLAFFIFRKEWYDIETDLTRLSVIIMGWQISYLSVFKKQKTNPMLSVMLVRMTFSYVDLFSSQLCVCAFLKCY